MSFGTIKIDTIVSNLRTIPLNSVVTTADSGTVGGAMIATNSNGYGVRTVQTGSAAPYGGNDGDICMKV